MQQQQGRKAKVTAGWVRFRERWGVVQVAETSRENRDKHQNRRPYRYGVNACKSKRSVWHANVGVEETTFVGKLSRNIINWSFPRAPNMRAIVPG